MKFETFKKAQLDQCFSKLNFLLFIEILEYIAFMNIYIVNIWSLNSVISKEKRYVTIWSVNFDRFKSF